MQGTTVVLLDTVAGVAAGMLHPTLPQWVDVGLKMHAWRLPGEPDLFQRTSALIEP